MTASPGEGPAGGPATESFGAVLARLRRALAAGLPGPEAQAALAPVGRAPTTLAEARAGGCREASALVLVYPRGGRAHTVLTLRPAGLAEHGGQVSLPGGRREPGEAPAACALREAREELGIATDDLTVLGPLSPLVVAPSAHCVQPFLAASDRRPAFRPAPAEVAELIELALEALADPALARRETWVLAGSPREVPFYAVGRHAVWGATAMVLAELASLWRSARAAAPAGAMGPADARP